MVKKINQYKRIYSSHLFRHVYNLKWVDFAIERLTHGKYNLLMRAVIGNEVVYQSASSESLQECFKKVTNALIFSPGGNLNMDMKMAASYH